MSISPLLKPAEHCARIHLRNCYVNARPEIPVDVNWTLAAENERHGLYTTNRDRTFMLWRVSSHISLSDLFKHCTRKRALRANIYGHEGEEIWCLCSDSLEMASWVVCLQSVIDSLPE